jgi:hypothetical protein
MDTKIEISVAELIALNTRAVIAEQKVVELEAKVAEMILNPPRKPRKPSVPKVRTPEEIEALRIKRSEAGKKGAETKRLNKLAEAAATKEQQEAALREQILKELAAEQPATTFEEDEF